MGQTSIEWTDLTDNPIRARNIETVRPGHFCVKTMNRVGRNRAGRLLDGKEHSDFPKAEG